MHENTKWTLGDRPNSDFAGDWTSLRWDGTADTCVPCDQDRMPSGTVFALQGTQMPSAPRQPGQGQEYGLQGWAD